MSTTTTSQPIPAALEVTNPSSGVPTFDEIRRLTAIPERRVVYRGVDWSFYERLVGAIPEGSNIHVDFDGRDLEVMSNGPNHEDVKDSLGQFVKVIAEEMAIPCKGLGETTWMRPGLPRGLECDLCYYFQPEKLAEVARLRGSNDVSGYPNPDLAIEVDISRPQVDRPGIYAALGVAEVWRFDGKKLMIERLTPDGTYAAVDASGFLPVRAEDVRRWLVEEDSQDESAWARRLRAEIRSRKPS
jgi:Uma2 family endonuclease